MDDLTDFESGVANSLAEFQEAKAAPKRRQRKTKEEEAYLQDGRTLDDKILPCRCSGSARTRYRRIQGMSKVWIECLNCPKLTYFCDHFSEAVEDWNRKNK